MRLTNINCPQCNGQLNQQEDKFYCTSCGSAFNVDYDDFTALSGKWKYPLGLNFQVKVSNTDVNVQARMSSVSTDNKTWPDRTQVTRRMKQVSLDELLDNLDL